jgi:SAM-dependent methyltransferase
VTAARTTAPTAPGAPRTGGGGAPGEIRWEPDGRHGSVARMSEDRQMHARQAASFGAQAQTYDRTRPGYPPGGVAWALGLPERGTAHGLRVLDLGAGTGKLTRELVALGADVTAVEPDAAMLERLRAVLPDVAAHRAPAEEIPLPDAGVDAVCVGQALHWFDEERALPEIARVLRPGGVLAGLWNADDHRVPWVARLAELEGRAVVRIVDERRPAAPKPGFPRVEHRFFGNRAPYTAATMTENIATRSAVAVLPDEQRAGVLARVRAHLDGVATGQDGTFELPMVTLVARWHAAGPA